MLLLLHVLALSGCSKLEGSGMPSTSAHAAERAGAGSRYVATAVGRVDSHGEARNIVAAVDGVIVQLLIARGETVRTGQPLLSVDCGARQAEMAARGADSDRASAAARTVLNGTRPEVQTALDEAVSESRAARDDAADRLAQAQALIDQGFISRRELHARTNALAQAEANLSQARAHAALGIQGPQESERREALAAARAGLAQANGARALASQCLMRSPVDGTVLQIFRREGEFSGASQGVVLAVVGDMSTRIVRAEITERDAARVRPGQAVDVWIDGDSRRWHGRVTSLAGVMGRRTARSLDPTDRFDRDSLEALIAFDGDAPPPIVGLRVMVGVRA